MELHMLSYVPGPSLGRKPLWFDSCKRSPSINDHSVFAFWLVAYGRFEFRSKLQQVWLGFGTRLCSKKKHIMLLAVLIFLEIMPKLCYFLKIMLSVTEIMLLRFYTDFKENKDHQWLNFINFDFNEHSYSPPCSLTVFSVANTHVHMISLFCHF